MVYNSTRWRKNSFLKNLKDYSVPLIWLFLILVLIFSLFWWWDDRVDENTENRVWVDLVLDSSDTDLSIEYSGWNKENYTSWMQLYKWEKIIVKEWSVSVTFPLSWDFRLNKFWELKYNDDWTFNLEAWDLWLNIKDNTSIAMRYANLDILEWSVVSLSQNEVESNIYVLKWVVEISNNWWQKTVLWNWQKISISRNDAAKEDIDLSLLKDDIDDNFKNDDWYIKNNWDFYLLSSSEETWTWKINTPNLTNSLISLENIRDEMTSDTSSLGVDWFYVWDQIAKITLNWVLADLDEENNTFSFSDISLTKKTNDLVIKVFDDANDILWKYVYTVYYNWWVNNNVSNPNTSWWFKVINFKANPSDFKFTAPSTTWLFTTYDAFVTIRWNVSAEWVSYVTVNDYRLSSFNWTTWRYHASSDNNNLEEWTNIYKINYYSEDWTLLYTNNFTIEKKVWTSAESNIIDTSSPDTETDVNQKERYSNEV